VDNQPRIAGTDRLVSEGAEVGAWRLHRAGPAAVPDAGAATRSIWRSPERADALVRLDLVETASPAAAQELLQRLLGEFEAPEVARQEEPAAGEVSYAMPGDTAVVFTRANVVAMVRNAGRDVVPVTGFARSLDDALTKM
jgi:hypothetical protein